MPPAYALAERQEQPAAPADTSSEGREQPAALAVTSSEGQEQPAAATDTSSEGQDQPAALAVTSSEGREQPAAPIMPVIPVLDSVAPDLVRTQRWINSPPTSIEELTASGEIVLIDFWTYTCYNCVNVFPSLKAWHETYGDLGLTIVGVHTPEFDFEKDFENLSAKVREHELEYPIVQDNQYATWRAFDNRFWPSLFLIDSDGRLRYRHIGEGAYADTEEIVRALLVEAGADLSAVAPVYP